MGVQRFEDLRVWQEAKTYATEIGALLGEPAFERDQQIRMQINGASLSVVANIAEGFVRGTRKEFHQFARIAAGSNGETRALLLVALARGYVDAVAVEPLLRRSDSIARMLRKLMASLSSQRT